eukprot:gene2102-2590_t
MKEEQENEILAISSIYFDKFKQEEVVEEDDNNNNNEKHINYTITITPDIPQGFNDLDNNEYYVQFDQSEDYSIYFTFQYPQGYPESELPIIKSIKSTWIQPQHSKLLYSHLESLWNPNELVIFQMVSWIQENAISTINNYYKSNLKSSPNNNRNRFRQSSQQQQQQQTNNNNNQTTPMIEKENVPIIYTGQSVTDRKSKFQAHLAIVNSERDVELVLDQLMTNKKIADATHNMYAYRFKLPNGQYVGKIYSIIKLHS